MQSKLHIIKYIPALNLSIAFIWLYTCAKTKAPIKCKIKKVFSLYLRLLGYLLLVAIFNILFDRIIQNTTAVTIGNIFFSCMYMFVIAHLLLRDIYSSTD